MTPWRSPRCSSKKFFRILHAELVTDFPQARDEFEVLRVFRGSPLAIGVARRGGRIHQELQCHAALVDAHRHIVEQRYCRELPRRADPIGHQIHRSAHLAAHEHAAKTVERQRVGGILRAGFFN